MGDSDENAAIQAAVWAARQGRYTARFEEEATLAAYLSDLSEMDKRVPSLISEFLLLASSYEPDNILIGKQEVVTVEERPRLFKKAKQINVTNWEPFVVRGHVLWSRPGIFENPGYVRRLDDGTRKLSDEGVVVALDGRVYGRVRYYKPTHLRLDDTQIRGHDEAHLALIPGLQSGFGGLGRDHEKPLTWVWRESPASPGCIGFHACHRSIVDQYAGRFSYTEFRTSKHRFAELRAGMDTVDDTLEWLTNKIGDFLAGVAT